jgi:hypothetical protein
VKCYYKKAKRVFKDLNFTQAPVAHTCNSSYSESKYQEDRGWKPAQENNSKDAISKNPFTHKKKG